MKEDIHAKYSKLMAKLHGKKKPPKGIMPMCQNCRNVELHQWYTGNVKDPLVCKCLRTGEYNVARALATRCDLYDYNDKWEIGMKYPKEHQTYHNPA